MVTDSPVNQDVGASNKKQNLDSLLSVDYNPEDFTSEFVKNP